MVWEEVAEEKKKIHGWKNTCDRHNLRLLLTGNTGKTDSIGKTGNTGSQSKAPSLWLHLSFLPFTIYLFLSLSSSLLSSKSSWHGDRPSWQRTLCEYFMNSEVNEESPPTLKPPKLSGHMSCHGEKNISMWCGSRTSEAAHWGDQTSAQLSTGPLQAATENLSTSFRSFHSQFEQIVSDWSLQDT